MSARIGTNVLDELTDFVRRRDHVSFAEIVRQLDEHGVPVRGDQALCLAADPNIILWAGMSEEFLGIMNAMLDERRIFPHPASHLVYFMDGGWLSYPIARRLPKGGYKTPHWAPVCFRCTPYENQRSGKKAGT